MKITDIKQQQKRADRYSLYGDGKYIFSLSEQALLTLRLHIGQEIDPTELTALIDKAAFDKLYDRALSYIALRPRSEWELTQYLIRKDASLQQQSQVLDRIRHLGYIDDESFTRSWVDSRRLLKSVSRRRLKQELQAKRVSGEIIDKVLADDDTNEVDVLKQLIDKKRRQSRYQDDQKLLQYLSRQGYGYSDIKQAMNDDL